MNTHPLRVEWLSDCEKLGPGETSKPTKYLVFADTGFNLLRLKTELRWMTTHVSADQVRWWLDDSAIQDVTQHSEEGNEFNFEVTFSRIPIHVIKGEKQGPIRIVGRTGFDTDMARHLVREDDARTGLLAQIGPVLASTPGFYAFLDEERNRSKLRDADILQMEHRIYPDEASQQSLMDSLMSIATGMRYVQNTIAANYPSTISEENESKENDSG